MNASRHEHDDADLSRCLARANALDVAIEDVREVRRSGNDDEGLRMLLVHDGPYRPRRSPVASFATAHGVARHGALASSPLTSASSRIPRTIAFRSSARYASSASTNFRSISSRR